MKNTISKFKVFNTIFASLLVSGAAFSTDLSENDDVNTNKIVQLYGDEIVSLDKKRQDIVNKYAPATISKTTFNGFNQGAETIEHDGLMFEIFDLPEDKNSKEYASKRSAFIKELPHDYAYASNYSYPLNLKPEYINGKGIIKISCSYKPGFFGAYGVSEYVFDVQTKISNYDNNLLNQYQKYMGLMPTYQIDDFNDREYKLVKFLPTADQFKTTNDEKIDIVTKHILNTISDLTDEYEKAKLERINVTNSYESCLNNEKVMVRQYNINFMEYRNYLINAITKLANHSNIFKNIDEEAAEDHNNKFLQSYIGQLKEFRINIKLYKESLLAFPNWFKDKNLDAPMYKDFYQSWK